jgi:hypothetical protein
MEKCLKRIKSPNLGREVLFRPSFFLDHVQSRSCQVNIIKCEAFGHRPKVIRRCKRALSFPEREDVNGGHERRQDVQIPEVHRRVSKRKA